MLLGARLPLESLRATHALEGAEVGQLAAVAGGRAHGPSRVPRRVQRDPAVHTGLEVAVGPLVAVAPRAPGGPKAGFAASASRRLLWP